eukprot:TRINITY_DN40313_c0_g1_i1.p1 TRINITY_DN40313_c0_g1~~TRINITY_DN40313_c0_g1_i1.p1  ORF type:complete len:591 (-),score=81.56 TRINITY_DN40313_c0_g1_i1:607-2355(-)
MGLASSGAAGDKTESTAAFAERLLDRLQWSAPDLSEELPLSDFADFLRNVPLEACLPRHSPAVAFSERRPRYLAEVGRIHVAVAGPSGACRGLLFSLLSRFVRGFFRGSSEPLAPGREAVAHHFLAPLLHKVVVWQLPEPTWGQTAELYIKEVGLRYFDHIILAFSDKHTLTETYSSLVVSLAVHGVPFSAVLAAANATSNADGDSAALADEDARMRRIQADMRRKDLQAHLLQGDRPVQSMSRLIMDLCRDIIRGRDSTAVFEQEGADVTVLGLPVRLYGLESRADLNGRCGICAGYNASSKRYLIRFQHCTKSSGNSEAGKDDHTSEISVKRDRMSLDSPRLGYLVGQVVALHGLQSRPELNGRIGLANEYSCSSDRYEVFLPSRSQGTQIVSVRPTPLRPFATISALNAALAHLDEVGNDDETSQQQASLDPSLADSVVVPDVKAETECCSTQELATPGGSPDPAAIGALAAGVPAVLTAGTASVKTSGARRVGAFSRFCATQREGNDNRNGYVADRSSVAPSAPARESCVQHESGCTEDGACGVAEEQDELAGLLPGRSKESEESGDLMTRIFAAERS